MKFFYTCRFFIIIFFLGLFQFSSAQTTIKGVIEDRATGEPLIGAIVTIKGTTDGTITDYDGAFEIRTDSSLPVTLLVSYVGYLERELEVTEADETLNITLEEGAITTEVVEVRGQRISEKQKAAPLTVESLDAIAIKQTASDNFYDGLGTLKGVDLTAASLGFKVINTRGFNSTSPVRSLQLIDGVDNQSPGLNFSLGNFLGSSELDVLRVDLVVGASSAFYGPNAFNGVIDITTKSPFLHKGLSARVKAGERNLVETALRWANSVTNNKGMDWFAYKLNFFYLRADDWEAENFDPVFNTRTGRNNPGGYDAVNIYGDEFFRGFDFSTFDLHTYPGLGIWHRTGYAESALVDYDTRNTKANAAFHFRLKPELAEASPEFIVSSSFGSGTTVYQGDNRFSLKNILFFQNRLEYRKDDKFFIRAYATHEDAGDSYDPFFTALLLQDSAKSNLIWGQDYVDFWLAEIAPIIRKDEDFPRLRVIPDPSAPNGFRTEFNRQKALDWLADNQDLLFEWHDMAEAYANQAIRPTNFAFFEPGSERFNEVFNDITGRLRTEGGTRFFDQSALYHLQGEYNFESNFFDNLTVGGSGRLYTPESMGTVFSDTAETITNYEYGIYGGFAKELFNKKLRTQGTLRVDKNENYDYLYSPAFSLVYKPTPNNYLRFSFSSAIRNPTLTDQFLFLNVGPAILSGNLTGVEGLVTIPSLRKWLGTLNPNDLDFFDIDPVKPEKVKTFELGYRSTLFNSLYVDATYYYNRYNDFLGFNIGADVDIDQQTGRPKKIQVFRYSANSTNEVTTQGFSIGLNYYFARYFQLTGNYSWNRLNKAFPDDPIIPAFNTPEHKYNIGFSGRDVPIRIGGLRLNNFGFNVNFKWIEGFLFEGSPQFTGFVPTYSLLDAQINYEFPKLNTTLKIGASNLLDNEQFQTYGGPRVGRLAYASLSYEFKKR